MRGFELPCSFDLIAELKNGNPYFPTGLFVDG